MRLAGKANHPVSNAPECHEAAGAFAP